MSHILCLWLPNWPIQRLLAEQGKREQDTSLILAAEGPRGGHAVACSAAAAAGGVQPNMPVAEAKSLVRGLVIARYDPAADRRALEQLAEACDQFSPCVALEESDAPECLLLDISHLEHLWGSPARLAARVEAFFTNRGWGTRIAVAPTVGMAWGWAHAHDEARTTNEKSKMPGHSSFVIHHSLLACLPIEALRIPADTAALLRQLGIETVAQLLALPRAELPSRFGDELLRRIGQWTGEAPEVLKPHRPPDPLVVCRHLEHPTADRLLLEHVLAELLDELARRLAARDRGAILLACEFGAIGRESTRFRVGLFQPSASPQQLRELVDLHLERAVFAGEVDRVEIRAAIVGRLGQRQGELFADQWPADPHQLALLINRLASRLGSEQVLRTELRPSPLPERAVRYAPMTGDSRDWGLGIRGWRSKTAHRNRHPSPQPPAPDPRPLLLYPHPHPIHVTCVAPGGPPQLVWVAAAGERIVRHWGPERIETLWWRGPSVRRDYYRVATESGAHLWLFRRLTDNRWFLHGVFA
jgi:protein ImuB